jgi:hypothetical protein
MTTESIHPSTLHESFDKNHTTQTKERGYLLYSGSVAMMPKREKMMMIDELAVMLENRFLERVSFFSRECGTCTSTVVRPQVLQYRGSREDICYSYTAMKV